MPYSVWIYIVLKKVSCGNVQYIRRCPTLLLQVSSSSHRVAVVHTRTVAIGTNEYASSLLRIYCSEWVSLLLAECLHWWWPHTADWARPPFAPWTLLVASFCSPLCSESEWLLSCSSSKGLRCMALYLLQRLHVRSTGIKVSKMQPYPAPVKKRIAK